METPQMNTIRTIVDAMKELAIAKDDAKTVINAAFDEYEQAGGALTKKGLKEVAKAVLAAETKEAATYHQAIADTLDSIGK